MPSQQPTISWVSLNPYIVGLLYRSILFHVCVLRIVKTKGLVNIPRLSNCLIGKCEIAQFFDWSVRSQGALEFDSVHINFVLFQLLLSIQEYFMNLLSRTRYEFLLK